MTGRSSVAAVLFAAALWTSGCAEAIRAPQAGNSLEIFTRRESGVCTNPINTSPLFSILSGRSLDPGGRAFAGFATVFVPGDPPIPCDRLSQVRAQGIFRFDVTTIDAVQADNFVGAYLDILSFEPTAPISVVEGEPWDLGFGEGWLGGTRPPRTNCLFSVHAAAQAWPPAPTTWGARGPVPINVADLRRGRIRFRAPGSPLTLDVTHEVGQWLRGESEELGFVIAPADAAIDMKTNSRCAGLFTVQLRVVYRS